MKINQHIITWFYKSEITRINFRKKIEFFWKIISKCFKITWILKCFWNVSRSREFWNALEMSRDHENFEMLFKCLKITRISKCFRNVSKLRWISKCSQDFSTWKYHKMIFEKKICHKQNDFKFNIMNEASLKLIWYCFFKSITCKLKSRQKKLDFRII
jgi:hypothetical protein